MDLGTLREILHAATCILSSKQSSPETIPLSPVESRERSFNSFPTEESNPTATVAEDVPSTTTATTNRLPSFLNIVKNITLYIAACLTISATLAFFFICIFYIYIGSNNYEVFRAWEPYCFALCGAWCIVFNLGLIIKKSIGDKRSFYAITYEVFHDVERCMVACGIIMLSLVLLLDVMYRTHGADEEVWWTVKGNDPDDVNEVLRKLKLEGYE